MSLPPQLRNNVQFAANVDDFYLSTSLRDKVFWFFVTEILTPSHNKDLLIQKTAAAPQLPESTGKANAAGVKKRTWMNPAIGRQLSDYYSNRISQLHRPTLLAVTLV